MLVALAQMNAVIGDFAGNRERILGFVRSALEGAGAPAGAAVPAGVAVPAGAAVPAGGNGAAGPGPARRGAPGRPDMVVFPELCLCGYPPMDLLDQESFVEESLAALRSLQRELPQGVAVAVGYVDRNRSGSGRPLQNAVAVIKDGAIVFSQAKTLLPTYDVFDEARYFEPASERRVFEFGGRRVGIAICEDIWWEAPPVPGLRYPVDPVKDLLDAGAELILVPSASPFHAGKLAVRGKLAADLAREGGVPVLYCNSLGGQDSLVFDGRSFALAADGALAAMAGWEEEILVVDTEALGRVGSPSRGFPAASPSFEAGDRWLEVEEALVLGIRDYMRKCGFKTACLGLSGGIDSALVAVLAARAIGAENLTCVSMPSRFSSEGSVTDAAELCRVLGIRLESLAIEGPFQAYLSLLEPAFAGMPFGLAEENLQARIRGVLMMAWSNKFGSLLLTTGNKSELAAGYCTLYGDMCGALAPIGDLLKTEVYALCRSINARARAAGLEFPIPLSTIDKPPSAELRPNQTDQDSLPPYEVLDAILSLYIVENLSGPEIVARGHDPGLVERIVGMVARAEYKRRQAAPVIKVSPRAFGTGRRMPIARAIHEAGSRRS